MSESVIRQWPVPIRRNALRFSATCLPFGSRGFDADQGDALALGGLRQHRVEGGERRGVALCQLEIRGVVDGEAVTARQGQHRRFFGRAVDDDRQTRQVAQKQRRIGFAQPGRGVYGRSACCVLRTTTGWHPAFIIADEPQSRAAKGCSSSVKAQATATEASSTNRISGGGARGALSAVP